MHGPVDHLHAALAALGASYVVNTVEVRPGFPMLLATLSAPGRRHARCSAGLPGNPQSAIVALVSLVAPALAGLTGRALPTLPTVELGAPIAGPRRVHASGAGPPGRATATASRSRTRRRRCCAASPRPSGSR